MGELTDRSLRLRAAALGTDNPLPPVAARPDLHVGGRSAAGLPPEVTQGLGYGQVRSLLPYSEKDGYGRALAETEVPVAVLENDQLRATFLLGLGGRLWSLHHRPTGSELLHSPPSLRLANLALRNAWFAGGVEWNIGTTGHSPTTCEPLFAQRVLGGDDEPILRMYEYERLRGVVFQVDAWLPDGSPVLLVHVCISNPTDHDVPMYWWSNAAVPESNGTRVVAPADDAYHFGRERTLRVVPVPRHDGTDVTYTARSPEAADHFFRIAAGERPWVAALDAEGSGLVQTSTDLLRGRKLFCWGASPGGRRWQEWLGEPGRPYLEVQAGLAATQLEHRRMPARARWSWVETYGRLDADPRGVHGRWSDARREVERALEDLVPGDRLDAALRQAIQLRDVPPAEQVFAGSGWGALEELRRARSGEPPAASPGTPFPADSLGAAQAPWVELVRSGELPDGEEAFDPVAGHGWADRLRAARGSWQIALQLGYPARSDGHDAAARAHCRRSLELRPNLWALRLLAAIDADDGEVESSARHLLAAHDLAPEHRHLAVEAARALLAAGRGSDALRVVESVAPAERSHGRVLLVEAAAAVAAGDLPRARDILRAGLTVDDIREGEDTLDLLWSAAFPDEPLPAAYDFRMWANET